MTHTISKKGNPKNDYFKMHRACLILSQMRDYDQPRLFEISWEVANKGIKI